MNWLLKVAAYRALSILPGGYGAYRFAQKRITRSLVPTKARVNQKAEVALLYRSALLAEGFRFEGSTHVDLGAGWHPTIPLMLHAFGVQRQFLLDVKPLFDAGLLRATLTSLSGIVDDPDWPHRSALVRSLPELPKLDEDWRGALEAAGIEYVAPYGDAWDRLAARADLVTSTQVLLHIPLEVLQSIFRQIYTALKPGGWFLATIHLRDLHATAANGLSPFNHLRYSPQMWDTIINTPLAPYNRLKAPDYKQLLLDAGFAIRRWDLDHGSEQDQAFFQQAIIHPSFEKYSNEDLSATHLFFAAQKPVG